MIRKAIIPAAGYGIRNLPATKVIPKELFPIGNKPAIDYVVAEAVQAGITDILIVLSRNKTEVMNYFDRSPELEAYLTERQKENLLPLIAPTKLNIQYVSQHEPLGLGHAILLGQSFAAGEPFAIMLPDQISLSRTSILTPLIKCFGQYRANVIGLQTVKQELLSNYGVVSASRLKARTYDIDSIVEKPLHPPSQLAVIGRYIVKPNIFDKLQQTRPGVNGEIQLTDALNEACLSNRMIGYAYNERWYDTSIEEQYIKLQQRALQLKSTKITTEAE
ncbi:UTP--glucose-1-phosphate uridylyltransferase [Paenibacillus harenae]|uniref:UTP--glucose-1-phosphate uridylyltransferase n=1 Tax=Paenibacillus harenae TaxID=306543 RepID=A0ABT9U421_PAEHA|nr:UTP--glucose-1-phosphate uridylyltransferase [Paenibacillus harenae]MDQ0114397.1 UTP--glucose-1-phosphate uridylyltransferase [Paenibacillus harenae]